MRFRFQALQITLALLACIYMFSATAFASESEFIETGTVAPNFRLNDQWMNVIELKDLLGAPVVIIYTGRKGFDASADIIKKLQERYAGKEGSAREDKVSIVGISNLKGLPFFLKKKVTKHMRKPEYPSFLMDWKGEIADAYGYYENGISVFIIDPEGKTRFTLKLESAREADQELFKIIESVSAGKQDSSRTAPVLK